MAADQCPACTAQVSATDVYCEACGHRLAEPVGVTTTSTAGLSTKDGRWISSAGPPDTCAGCGGTDFGAEGYCDGCGQRRPAAKDHSELELGHLAAVTDKGHRHHHNEDAVGLALLSGVSVGIVCDGVSSSTRPDTASNSAVQAALATLVEALGRGSPVAEALDTAAGAAQAAATLAAGSDPGPNPPASTFVCAVVERLAVDGMGDNAIVTIGWVGDSRAYWVPDGAGEPACLTVDDSMAGQLGAQGLAVPADIPAGQAVALMRWLGADAIDTAPHVRTFTPDGPGRVLVCSDGLFRYRPGAAELAKSTPDTPPLETARSLVRLALDAGGQDNIAVAVLTCPPLAEGTEPEAGNR